MPKWTPLIALLLAASSCGNGPVNRDSLPHNQWCARAANGSAWETHREYYAGSHERFCTIFPSEGPPVQLIVP